MKSIIVFYSYSGNTQQVAKILAEYLRQKGEVELRELKTVDETGSFFVQAFGAFKHKRAKIEPLNSDLGRYDLICLGTPVWAFAPVPAMNTYLDKCSGLEGKEVILFTTYGSGSGNKRCLNYMQGLLSPKGVKTFKRFSVQQGKVKDKEWVFKELMRLWPKG